MGHRNDGDGQAGHGADCRRVDPAGIDDALGFNPLLSGLHGPDAALRHLDGGDTKALADPGATASGPFRQREREPAGIEIAVGWQKGRAGDPIRRHERKSSPRFISAEQLKWQTKAGPPSGLTLEFLHASRRGCQAQAAHRPPADIDAGLLPDPLIEGDAVHHQPR